MPFKVVTATHMARHGQYRNLSTGKLCSQIQERVIQGQFYQRCFVAPGLHVLNCWWVCRGTCGKGLAEKDYPWFHCRWSVHDLRYFSSDKVLNKKTKVDRYART